MAIQPLSYLSEKTYNDAIKYPHRKVYLRDKKLLRLSHTVLVWYDRFNQSVRGEFNACTLKQLGRSLEIFMVPLPLPVWWSLVKKIALWATTEK